MTPVTQMPPPNPYGGVPYGSFPQQDHPQATLVLILGIVGIVVCGVAAPFAWVIGNRVVREIDASGGQVGGRSTANAGRICGIIGTAFIALGLLFGIAIVFLALIPAVQA